MELRQRQTSHREMSHRVIPSEVLAQMREHLDSLPIHIRRMVVLLIECGMRVNEVCALPFACLEQRSGLLRTGSLKLGEERIIPLSPSTALVVQAQQQVLLQEQHGAIDLLFRDSKGQAISPRTLLSMLNRLAIEKDIRDATGTVWRFRALQFRNTLALRMVQQNIPFYVLQQYFGSRSMMPSSVVTLMHGHIATDIHLRYPRQTTD
jgi:integrase